MSRRTVLAETPSIAAPSFKLTEIGEAGIIGHLGGTLRRFMARPDKSILTESSGGGKEAARELKKFKF